MQWVRVLGYITRTADGELLARNEFPAAEKRIPMAQIKGRLSLSDADNRTLTGIGHRLGRKTLEDGVNAARPDAILSWYRKPIAFKFDGAITRRCPQRLRVESELGQLVVRMARDNIGWCYDRSGGAMAKLSYSPSDETVVNIVGREGIPPAPDRERSTTWKAFIRARTAVLAATDLFTAEVAHNWSSTTLWFSSRSRAVTSRAPGPPPTILKPG